MACILVIDDESDLRATMRAGLEIDGHEVFEASNGALGMALLATIQPDVIITDIMMPESDGIETIIGLRRDYPNIRIIAISGGGLRGSNYLSLAEKFGAMQVLAKPFRRQQLLDAVREALDTSNTD